MFVQVIQGRVSDAAAMRGELDRWHHELAHGAEGYLGTTAGVTDDGEFVALVRFESEEQARRNSDRPEQGQWWEQASKLFESEPTFRDSSDVDVDTPGDPGQARFVQVMQGRTSDPARVRELMRMDSEGWARFRPDILGSVSVGYEGGDYTVAVYFTSEADARAGEQKAPPPELKERWDEMTGLEVGTPRFLDLRDPWLY